MAQRFILREATSDIAGALVLSDIASRVVVPMDFVLAAAAALGTVEDFVSPQPLPGVQTWKAGGYTLTLEVVKSPSINFTAELWRADKDGVDVSQVGSQPSIQSGTGTKSFSFTGTELSVLKTDRLKLKLLAENTDGTDSQTLQISASLSALQSPIDSPQGARTPASVLTRTRFLDSPRPSEKEQRKELALGAPGVRWDEI